jgi:cytochrome c-type biogenesis protein CcmI
MIWIVFLGLAALALFLLLRPLLSASAAVNDARTSELAVYRDQLSELDARSDFTCRSGSGPQRNQT